MLIFNICTRCTFVFWTELLGNRDNTKAKEMKKGKRISTKHYTKINIKQHERHLNKVQTLVSVTCVITATEHLKTRWYNNDQFFGI